MNETTVVQIPAKYTWIFTALGALVGVLAAFIVGPLVSWLLGLIGDAPGPLRLAAELPFAWAVPVLTVVGAIAGFLIAASWNDDAGTIEVNDAGITVHSKDADRYVPKAKTDRVAAEKKELVILDVQTSEIFRGPVEDEMLPGLRVALAARGYPQLETSDPYGDRFVTWVEGGGQLDEKTEDLLRARRRALADDQAGAAEDALDRLRRSGVMVRDRDGRQEYRRLAEVR